MLHRFLELNSVKHHHFTNENFYETPFTQSEYIHIHNNINIAYNLLIADLADCANIRVIRMEKVSTLASAAREQTVFSTKLRFINNIGYYTHKLINLN